MAMCTSSTVAHEASRSLGSHSIIPPEVEGKIALQMPQECFIFHLSVRPGEASEQEMLEPLD
eukprot:7378917-Pyramimonas_sp.AAC.1